MNQENETRVALFQNKEIRKVMHKNEWWFSVVDVCGVLSESTDSGSYWRKLKQRLNEEGSEIVTFCHGLKLKASDGKSFLKKCFQVLIRKMTSFPQKCLQNP